MIDDDVQEKLTLSSKSWCEYTGFLTETAFTANRHV